ncbi:MAG: sel1 repeat family protein [Candidatus Thioglobus sp.]|nr:MAG: sel1 repeat family protein [Candidatus Thioglobus sp.]KAA0449556.1 MAG: sel1 repeat family protein [Candidatus Thioglobus sp.]
MKNYQQIIKLAESGDAKSQYKMGLIFELGLEVEKDLAQAFAWYAKSAEQQYAKSQYNLAIFLALGKGVTKDIKQAKHWIKCAKANGYSGAIF